MRNKSILSLVAAVVVLLSGAAIWAQTGSDNSGPSQEQHERRGRRGGGFERMAQALNLTEEQKSQIQPILQQQRQKLEALRNDNSLSQQQKREQFQQIREQTRSQINAILTPDQQQKMQQMEQQMRQRRGRRGGPGGPAGAAPPPQNP